MTLMTPVERGHLTVSNPGAERLRKRSRHAFALVGLLVVGFLGLGALLSINGAVIGSGAVAVQSDVRTITHATGGTLTALLVKDGQHVARGQELLRLDTSVSQVGSQSAALSLHQLLARAARLQAERDGLDRIATPAGLGPDAAALMVPEIRVFTLRREERRGSLALLGERVRQYDSQIASYQAQISAIDQQAKLIQPELDGLRKLYARQLVTINRVNEMERTAVQFEGSRAALLSNIAEARAEIAQTREQMLNVDKTARSEAGNQLTDVMTQINDQTVRRASAGDTFARSIIRAPQSGTIDKIAFTTVGSAVPPAQPIMEIVPDRDRMVIEAHIRPGDVEKVHVGQPARILFPGLDRSTTPDIPGAVSFVAPELTQDAHTGATFYRIRVSIDAKVVQAGLPVALQAGMPAEVFVQTDRRSILSFLTKPLIDQIGHAMRE